MTHNRLFSTAARKKSSGDRGGSNGKAAIAQSPDPASVGAIAH
ncbi:hypothetical protein [Oxynema aestuarii]|nr:hypothetical protein [Oxynema aestuarii]